MGGWGTDAEATGVSDRQLRPRVLFHGPPPIVIAKRRDFLACAKTRKWAAPGMVVQGRYRGDQDPPRVGYTCSRKTGNAVMRNRAKRRLRETARAIIPEAGHKGWDYVLIGRAGATADRPFAALLDDLRAALARFHGSGKRP